MDIHLTKQKQTHKTNSIPVVLLFISTLISLTASAQEKTMHAEKTSVLQNPLFIVLFSILIILLLVIIVFAKMVKATAAYKNEKDNKSSSGISKTLLAVLTLSAASHSLFAQTENTSPAIHAASSYWGLDSFTFYFMLTLIALEVFIAWMLYDISMQFLGVKERKQKEAEEKAKALINEPSFLEKINASVAIEKETDIMFDHEYDGIRELDNNLPPWWKYGFFVTVVFAFVYLIHYQVLHTGKSPNEEYEEQLAKGKADIEEYRKKAANLVDENNASLLTDNESLESGKSIYIENCAPCHGKSGEGNVGPNLTDDYWRHQGGDRKSVV